MPIRFLLIATLVAAVGCGKNHCPEGMATDGKRSKAGRVVVCVDPRETSRSLWIELYDSKRRKQSCPFVGGRPGGTYQAWHKDGTRWLEGRYATGLKIGRWTQWAPDGRAIGDGEYRDGQLIAGAPVGAPASCEAVTW